MSTRPNKQRDGIGNKDAAHFIGYFVTSLTKMLLTSLGVDPASPSEVFCQAECYRQSEARICGRFQSTVN